MEYAISKAGKQKESLTLSPREKIWSCNIHDKHYLNSFQYETHLKQAHQGNYECPQETTNVHLGKGFMCPIPICVKQFTSCRGCDLHASRHSEPEKFRCDNCSYVSQDKDLLRTHTMEHSMSRRYQCCYCSKHFDRSNDCKRHELKWSAIMESGSQKVMENKRRNQKDSTTVDVERHVT